MTCLPTPQNPILPSIFCELAGCVPLRNVKSRFPDINHGCVEIVALLSNMFDANLT